MDVYNVLSVIFALITVLGTSRVLGRVGKDDMLQRNDNVYRVTDSTCGQEMLLSRRFKNEIVLLYDESLANDSCVMHIKNRNSRWYSKICVETHDVFSSVNGKIFRLYFGDYPSKNATHYFKWQDLLEKVCSEHGCVHVVFNASHRFDNDTKLQLKVSRSKRFSKRSEYSSLNDWSSWEPWSPSSWSSWDSWSMRTISHWSSWSATPSWRSDYDKYEREKEERRKKSATTGVIVLAVLGSIFLIVCCVGLIAWANHRKNLTRDEIQQSVQSSEPDPPEHRLFSSAPPDYAVLMSGDNTVNGTRNRDSSTGHAIWNIDGCQVQTPSETAVIDGSMRQQIADATAPGSIAPGPDEEGPENAELELPPPSYSSLFATQNYNQQNMT